MKTATTSVMLSFIFIFLSTVFAWDDDFCDHSRVAPHPKYSYEGDAPLHWGKKNPEYAKCTAGRRQSPINVIPNFSAPSLPPAKPVFIPHKAVMRFGKDSHNYEFACEESFHSCGHLNYGNIAYKLIQIHSHSPSEHTVNGTRYPLELHFVHQSAAGQLAVFGTLFKFGKYNQELQNIIDAAQKRHYAVIDLEKLSGMTQANACRYDGSLTTPPCTQGVRWIVSLHVMEATMRQVGQFREQLGESPNSRPLQNLNGREVSCYAI